MIKSILFFGILSCLWIGCQSTKSISDSLAFSDIQKHERNPTKVVSPSSDFVAYQYKGSKNTGLARGISTVYVVREKDDQVLFNENLYVDEIRWLSDDIVQIKLRPEVMKKSGEVEVIKFNVRSEKRSSLKISNQSR